MVDSLWYYMQQETHIPLKNPIQCLDEPKLKAGNCIRNILITKSRAVEEIEFNHVE